MTEPQKPNETWETPTLTEVAMNAEIGSYQEDPERGGGPDWVKADEPTPET